MKKKREKEEGFRDITSFFAEEERPTKPVKSAANIDEIERLVHDYISSRGSVTKSELYKWVKERRLPLADFYKALRSLLSRSEIKKEFSEEREEIVYTV